MSDGSACVMSVDGLASLTLMPHRQTFIVKFLAEVRYDSTKVTCTVFLDSSRTLSLLAVINKLFHVTI